MPGNERRNLSRYPPCKTVHTFSDPTRDPRHHTVSTVFVAAATGTPEAADDAAGIGIFTENNLPEDIVFDHRQILDDYFSEKY